MHGIMHALRESQRWHDACWRCASPVTEWRLLATRTGSSPERQSEAAPGICRLAQQHLRKFSVDTALMSHHGPVESSAAGSRACSTCMQLQAAPKPLPVRRLVLLPCLPHALTWRLGCRVVGEAHARAVRGLRPTQEGPAALGLLRRSCRLACLKWLRLLLIRACRAGAAAKMSMPSRERLPEVRRSGAQRPGVAYLPLHDRQAGSQQPRGKQAALFGWQRLLCQ